MSHSQQSFQSAATPAQLEAAWSPIHQTLTLAWECIVLGNKDANLTVEAWMICKIQVNDWFVKGPAQQGNPAEADKVDFVRRVREFLEKHITASVEKLTIQCLMDLFNINNPDKKVGDLTWNELAWKRLKAKLLEELFLAVDVGRSGGQWDKTVLVKLKQMLLSIGKNDQDGAGPATKHQVLYTTQLLEPYIFKTKAFYQKESAAFLAKHTVVEYLRKVDARLNEEEDLAQRSLLATSVEQVVRACEQVLISSCLDQLKGAFREMLQNEKEDDMRFFFKILKRVPDGLRESAATLGEKLTSEGKALITQQSAQLSNKKALQHSPECVSQLIALHAKYCRIVKDCFDDEIIFQQAMDRSFTELANSEVGAFSMPEILNFYLDKQLKDKKVEEAAIDQAFDSLVALVVYLRDRDMFEKAAARSLGKRLLASKSSTSREESFLQKLRTKCGDSSTRTMVDMMNDVRTSDERAAEFSDWMKTRYPNVKQSINVKVLNSHRWTNLSRLDIQLQDEWIPMISGFEGWYKEVYPQRKLNWNFAQGQTTMTVNYHEKGRSKTFEIQLTVLQASVLLLFNDSPVLSFNDICQRLAISQPDQLTSGIAPLVYFKAYPLLVRKPAEVDMEGDDSNGAEGATPTTSSKKGTGEKDEEIILTSDTFQLKVLDKAPPKPRFAYPPATANAVRAESTQDRAKVIEERNLKLDLAIVRTMKSRNVITDQELLAEVARQLIQSFPVDRRAYRSRIESLIERGYMGRDTNDISRYHYIA